ncbi:hypothetical protein EHS25_001862 [Saitozyma podzolica]|uniref:Phytanoyl-CoA dioxygenase n=1 Tax=Saitozyma podzolica TaxID=1890683 RepID=A0A427YFK7_9TREE|nr:hypothetical protein EHS25_001862 [Saitozyma podzolica]
MAEMKYQYLKPEDVQHFLQHGWLRVSDALKQEYVDRWMADMWTRIGYDQSDKSTWHTEYMHIPRHREIRHEDFSPKGWAAICDLVGGEDRLHNLYERWVGDQFVCNFGSAERTSQVEEPVKSRKTWHIDNDWFRHFLDSSNVALTVIHCFTDIPKRGGGTILCEDGLKGAKAAACFDPPYHNTGTFDIIQTCQTFTTLEAKAGDVILLHGLLPHTNSLNYLHYARIITNPHACLKAPLNFNRVDGNYSLVEQAILERLGRKSLPEWKITRERANYHPRTDGFRRARVREELDNLVAAAKAKGLDESYVDSIHLRGEAAIREHERRHAYDLPLGPHGLRMDPLKMA